MIKIVPNPILSLFFLGIRQSSATAIDKKVTMQLSHSCLACMCLLNRNI